MSSAPDPIVRAAGPGFPDPDDLLTPEELFWTAFDSLVEDGAFGEAEERAGIRVVPGEGRVALVVDLDGDPEDRLRAVRDFLISLEVRLLSRAS